MKGDIFFILKNKAKQKLLSLFQSLAKLLVGGFDLVTQSIILQDLGAQLSLLASMAYGWWLGTDAGRREGEKRGKMALPAAATDSSTHAVLQCLPSDHRSELVMLGTPLPVTHL